MPREYAQTNISIWQDRDWRALPFPAQYLYQVLWNHPQLSYCGVVDWRPARLTAMASGLTREIIETLAACLSARYFIVVDEETEEVLIRSWARWDGLMKQPRLAVSFANAHAATASNTIRACVVHEAKKLRDRDPGLPAWDKPQVKALLDLESIDPKGLATPSDPFGQGFACLLGTGLGDVSVPFGPNVTSGLGDVSVPPTPTPTPAPYSSSSSSSEMSVEPAADPEAGVTQQPLSEVASDPDDDPREEVRELCEKLAAGVIRNGHKAPTIGKRWYRAMRLLLDVDGRTADQVEKAIDWALADPFWSTNIRSAQSLREKYDTLRAQASRPRLAEVPGNRRQQAREDALAAARAEAAALDQVLATPQREIA